MSVLFVNNKNLTKLVNLKKEEPKKSLFQELSVIFFNFLYYSKDEALTNIIFYEIIYSYI